MKKSIITLLIMAFSAIQSIAQIDLHSHAITKDYMDYIKANGAELDEGFPLPSWDVEQHIAFMDKAGIQTSVLTMPAPQPWFGDAEASAAVCRSHNEECAALKSRYPNARRLFGENLPLRQYGEKIVRLAEIEVVPEHLEEYMAFAKEVGETSVKVEPGVLTLFSMQTKEDPCKIYILEIYADQEAYQSHIQTAHFRKYKEGTAKMVKSLKLIDVNPLAGMGNMVNIKTMSLHTIRFGTREAPCQGVFWCICKRS